MLTAVLTGLIVGTIAGVLSLFAEASAAKQSAIAGISTFAVLSAGSMLMWPDEFRVLGEREIVIPLNVSFLFGFEISNHLAYVALPISLLSAGLVWWTVRKDRMLLAV
jgi:predicted metal-binding membrane protein